MRARHLRLALLAAAPLLLGACASELGVNRFNASFGEASQANMFAQGMQYRRGEYLMQIREAFVEENQDTVNFAFDKSFLDEEARRALDGQAAWLRAHPDVRVRVVGHADLVGGERYNDRLGLRRARAVARYLQGKGVRRSRIDAVESRGEREPVVQTEQRERRNRRSQTQVAGFTHGFVGDGMDGRRALLMYRRYASDSVVSPKRIDTTSETQ